MQNGLRKGLLQETILALALCHNTQTKYLKSDDSFINGAFQSFDKLFIEFSNFYNVKFICSTRL